MRDATRGTTAVAAEEKAEVGGSEERGLEPPIAGGELRKEEVETAGWGRGCPPVAQRESDTKVSRTDGLMSQVEP